MEQIKYFTGSAYSVELQYLLDIVSQSYAISFVRVADQAEAHCTIGAEASDKVLFSPHLFDALYAPAFDPKAIMGNGKAIMIVGQVDYLSTIFFLVNCLQEFNATADERDHYGRFKSAASLQVKNQLLKENYVQELIDKLIVSINPIFQKLKRNRKTRIFLSHDIDIVSGSLLQDTYWCVKKLKWMTAFEVVLKNVIQKPQWLNMDRIMKIESEYDFKSTFFWLAEAGHTINGLKNSDYEIKGTKVLNEMKNIVDRGWYNGIHKSIGSTTFASELEKLPKIVQSNRYHYLYFDVQRGMKEVNSAGLRFDSSIGWADCMGYRNSYGLPVQLFNVDDRKPYAFVECPLTFMDTTYHFYQKKTANQFAMDVISFVEKNSAECVLSLLFHNNYISEYKFGDYLTAFKKILAYFYENQFTCITQEEVVKEFYVKY